MCSGAFMQEYTVPVSYCFNWAYPMISGQERTWAHANLFLESRAKIERTYKIDIRYNPSKTKLYLALPQHRVVAKIKIKK